MKPPSKTRNHPYPKPRGQVRNFRVTLTILSGLRPSGSSERSDFGASTPGITVVVGFPFTASTAPPCASTKGGRERANLTRPPRARITAATLSRSITTRQLLHQSLRFSRLSDWSLSPHLGQVTLEPLVSRLDRRMTGSPAHLALYSNCRWAILKLHPFILPRYFLV